MNTTYDMADLTKTSVDVRKSIERLEVAGRKLQMTPEAKKSPDPAVQKSPSPSKAESEGPVMIKPRAEVQQEPKQGSGQARKTKQIPQKPVSQSVENQESPLRAGTRTAEARKVLAKAKHYLAQGMNIRKDIKNEVTLAIDRLYQLVKEGEIQRDKQRLETSEAVEETITEQIEMRQEKENKRVNQEEVNELKLNINIVEEHSNLLRENTRRMVSLQEALDQQKETLEKTTYASVAAGQTRRQPNDSTTLHSVVVSSKDDQDTGEQVLEKIREVINAKEGGIRVDRVRKARDRKVIVGCRTVEERDKIKERLKKAEEHLTVEEIRNKDPLLILKDVLEYNTDEDIIKALRTQNEKVFRNLDGLDKIEVRYRRRTRNPYLNHVVIKVPPQIWNRMLDIGEVHIDLQRIKVADQSPLIQCSLCLAFGHGRRFCKETVEKCSHCGGPHLKAKCEEWLSDTPPSCCNCTQAKLDKNEHNAFSQDCPIRRKWDTLARATVAYC